MARISASTLSVSLALGGLLIVEAGAFGAREGLFEDLLRHPADARPEEAALVEPGTVVPGAHPGSEDAGEHAALVSSLPQAPPTLPVPPGGPVLDALGSRAVVPAQVPGPAGAGAPTPSGGAPSTVFASSALPGDLVHDLGSTGGPTIATEGGPVVAVLELPNPQMGTFVLRGTFPCPKYAFPHAAKKSQFAVLAPDGNRYPAQTERVSSYAREEWGADVVEITAVVPRDPDVVAGTPVQYEVCLSKHWTPHPVDADNAELSDLVGLGSAVHPGVRELLDQPWGLMVASQDVFGNWYTHDLIHASVNSEWKRFGHTSAELRTYGVMKPIFPVSGPQATLPHGLGIHGYVNVMAGEKLFGLDLRITNGADGRLPNDPLDDALDEVYFRNLWLLVPNGWVPVQEFEDPAMGPLQILGGWTGLPLVADRADGTLHYMPRTAQTHRRMMITPVPNRDRARAYLDQQHIGYARPATSEHPNLWSWWNSDTARYFPQRHVLPDLSHASLEIEADLAQELGFLRNLFDTGTGFGSYPVKHERLGWAHPYGVPYGGMTGGDGIHMWQGLRTLHAASPVGLQRMRLEHRMHSDRMPNAYYQANGDSSSLEEWLEPNPGGPGPYIDMTFYLQLWNGDPMGFKTAPTFQVDAVEAQGLVPDYKSTLELFAIYDLQHLIRYTRNAKALTWLTNDSLAKDDLLHQAEMVHLTYNNDFNDPYGKESEGGLAWDRSFVALHPGQGFTAGRGEGWAIDTMTSAWSVADLDWRERKAPWYELVTDVFADGQHCEGYFQATVYQKFLDEKYHARQSIEAAIVENALWGMKESVFRGRNGLYVAILEDVLKDSFYGMITPEAWPDGNAGPWTVLAVSPLDVNQPPFCNGIPSDGQSNEIDTFQVVSSLAYAYELTGDQAFLDRAEDLVGGPLLSTMLAQGTANLFNRAALLALAQGK